MMSKGWGVPAQPVDLGKEAISSRESLGVERRKSQKMLASLTQKPLPPGLPAFLKGSFCWAVEFSQERLLPAGPGFSVLPRPPRAGLPLGWGVREEKGTLPQRDWVFTEYACTEGKVFRAWGALMGFLFIIIIFSQAGWTSWPGLRLLCPRALARGDGSWGG